MPFGFGFNKAKVLASAEKNVKAGKLQHAIADYEKVVKEDPKDLTVLNTIGDLYARLGNTEQATSYYKRVGDAFATNGFTVKAIAMYKKITKLDTSGVDSLTRLAELYAQQGLHNDARAQYVLVAEHHLKAGSLDRAANIFHKVLDLDPENAAMQAKLAELYVRLGKKNEARDIYLRNAEMYRSRKNFAAADESLGQVLAIDRTFSQAILLRGLVRMELADAAGALQCLEQVPDIETRPEGLRSLLKAYFALGKIDSAGPLARKMYAVSQDTQGLSTYGEALVHAGRAEEALALYTEFGDVLLSAQNETVIAGLQGCIARVKDNPAALEQLSGLLERAGHTTNLAEIKELLAHASVQSGDLAKARELYRELARIEPDNPLHTQNYRQVLVKLGEDSSARPLSAEEAAQPMLVDEMEGSLPEIPGEYAPEVMEAVHAAVTEAELFDSYNLPAKAVMPLEAVLARAPNDPQVNQRLASLYARTNRLADAAARCRVLEQVYQKAGHQHQANEYADLASKYAGRGGGAAETVPAPAAPPVFEPPKPKATRVQESATPPAFGVEEIERSGSVAEFEFVPSMAEPVEHAPAATTAPAEKTAAAAPAQATPSEPAHVAPTPSIPKPTPVAAPQAPPSPVVRATPPPAPAAASAEIDLSAEWEQVTEVEGESELSAIASQEPEAAMAADPLLEEHPVAHVTPPVFEQATTTQKAGQAELVSSPHESSVERAAPSHKADAAIFQMLGATPESGYPEHISDLIEEIRFYASQSMWDEVHGAMARLEREAPEAAANLRHELEGHAPAASSSAAEPFADFTSHHAVSPEHAAEPIEATPAAHTDEPLAPAGHFSHETEPFEEHAAHQPRPLTSADPFAHEAAAFAGHDLFADEPLINAELHGHETVASHESSFAASAAEPLLTDVEPVLEAVEVGNSPHGARSNHNDSVDNLLDLDSALGEDFEIVAVGANEAHALAAAASVGGHTAQPVAAAAAPAMVAPPVAPTPILTPAVAGNSPSAVPQATGSAATDGAFDFSDGALADIFNEFKHDMEGAGAGTPEDPETHYNLGVAFKEMGLLDEAIGELQKVCQAIDQGEPFPQALQAYTWLADCFVQKGVPEAAIRWYEKALRSPHVGAETATAIHYELACACEQAGNRSAALTHFMEVYGTNIDYRDVAERIKSLKS